MNNGYKITISLTDDDMLLLHRAKVLARRLFGLDQAVSASEVVSWMLRSTPWDELVAARGAATGNAREVGEGIDEKTV